MTPAQLWDFLVGTAALIKPHNEHVAYLLDAVAGCVYDERDLIKLRQIVRKWVGESLSTNDPLPEDE
jgi:hypothetical protein